MIMNTLFPYRLTVAAFAAAASLLTHASAALVGWSARVNFDEFVGLPGGFQNDSAGPIQLATPTNPNGLTRSYDVMTQTGTDAVTGNKYFGNGQDGVTDMTIRTQMFTSAGLPWRTAQAEKIAGAFGTFLTTRIATSRPGDYMVTAYEVSFDSALGLTADDLQVNVENTNGFGELYEWSMVTVGGIADAPFTQGQIGSYGGRNYSNLTNSSYLNPDGTVEAGGVATNTLLPRGQTISQFLSGTPGGPANNIVRAGWYAQDDFNVDILNGPEDDLSNPDGSLDKRELFVTNENLGMADGTGVSKITVWLGYQDVAFDTNGNGTTQTSSTQEQVFSNITIGSKWVTPVPEPGAALCGLMGAVTLMLRRRR
jgi:hypothetical protein